MSNPNPLMRVLVVDDSRDVAELMQEVLTLEGFEAACVFTAARALQRCRQDDWHALLIDLNLPDQPGLALAHTLRHGLLRVPRLAALSGESRLTLQGVVQPGGFDAAFQKPVNLPRLLAWLRQPNPVC